MPYFKVKKVLVLLSVFVVILVVFTHSIHANSVNKGAIVLLIAKDSTGKILGTGTGFIVKPEGTLVTNYHVLVDAATVDVVMSNSDRVQVKSILKVDRSKDFALLQLPKDFYSTLKKLVILIILKVLIS